MTLSDAMRVMFSSTGPRRQAVQENKEKLEKLTDETKQSVRNNLIAVQDLIRSTLDVVEGRKPGYDR